MKLDSWQAIADYLGRDIRTVARWERERGLPVYRGPAHRPNTVFAYAEELEDWLATHGKQLPEEDAVPPPPPAAVKPAVRKQVAEAEGEGEGTSRRLVVVLLSVLLIPTVVWAVWEARFAPLALQSVTSEGRSIAALTTTGSVAWTYLPPPPLALPRAERFSDVGNLDGSPHPEVIAAPIGSYEAADRLYALSNRGALLWEKALADTLTFGSTTYGAPWRSTAVRRFEVDGVPQIAWAVHHQVGWPSLLAVLDARGEVRHRFAHAGWLTAIRATPDGAHLLAAGVSDAYQGYALAVLDARSPGGSSPPPPDPEYQCHGCPDGAPVRYLVLGRSELAVAAAAPLLHELTPPSIVMLPSGAFEVHARQSPGETSDADATFEFDANFMLRRSRVSEAYWVWHQELERTGKITHTAAECPDRRGLPIREWTPVAGWRELSAR